jgi:hypothetical protein
MIIRRKSAPEGHSKIYEEELKEQEKDREREQRREQEQRRSSEKPADRTEEEEE